MQTLLDTESPVSIVCIDFSVESVVDSYCYRSDRGGPKGCSKGRDKVFHHISEEL